MSETSRDGLEIDIVLENHAGQPIEAAGVLDERRIFELQYVDATEVDLTMDQPLEMGIGELADCIRRDGCAPAGVASSTHRQLDGRAKGAQLFVGLALLRRFQQRDHVYFGPLRQLAQCPVHEDATAVDRRADGIRRYEQNSQGLMLWIDGAEAVPEIAAERPAECLGVIYFGQRAGTPARAQGARKLQKCAP